MDNVEVNALHSSVPVRRKVKQMDVKDASKPFIIGFQVYFLHLKPF